ncbi:NAD-dependent epimerase/dehydratase family protein [Terrabacter sp. LjRoot27]|uniref:polysaccharide biosynthesis C-terminal domain-containing protein n=1 Tax=Terrabacter sp. LjRoot27 TaxID=3342306 RepID=UPI003ECE99A3
MKVALTGAGGFLGWHTRLRLHATGAYDVVAVGRDDWPDLAHLLRDVDAVIHIAGVNRGEPDEIEAENVRLAEDVAAATAHRNYPTRIVFANSIQDSNGSPYGTGKARAREVLSAACAASGSVFVDVRLPNLFGEHGRPQYNSFVATFVHAVRDGASPQIQDRQVGLLHAQDAAEELIRSLEGPTRVVVPDVTEVGVQEVLDLLQEFDRSYATGEFPDLSTKFRVDLFNTYRAALFPERSPILLTPHADARGSFVETVRCRGGEGQTSFSTTVPGITRGEHYHLTKIERFAVIDGQARISLRKMFTDDVIDFDVEGAHPCAVDMPVGWVHNITNTGDTVLLTQFWSHELFRPEAPDTFPEPVRPLNDNQEKP